jgi:phage baseplate assembly protein W
VAESYQDYDVWKQIWPDDEKKPLAPVRVGMDRTTGKILVGWPHVEQSIGTIFRTRFHERILRQWVGSFVPHLLGKNLVQHTFTQFFWAIASALDLWEPCYRLVRVFVKNRSTGTPLTSAEEVRRGEVQFENQGMYMPRGHLGDFTPETERAVGWVPRASPDFDRLNT